jgi:nitrite reductase/ring-hydroxylating ferredoxin subunit/uncharacterized membrane protein
MMHLREPLAHLTQRIAGYQPLDRIGNPAAALVQRATGPTEIKNLLSGTWLGHPLHPMLTDLPIGAWTMASVLDLTTGESGAMAARHLVGLGVLTALPTAAAGASDWSDTYGPEQRIGTVHALANITATLLQAMSWGARRNGQRRTGIALSGAALGLTAGSAYLGGHLTFVRGTGVDHTAFQPAVKKWTDVAAQSDLQMDVPIRVKAKGVPVVLVQRDDTVYALSATCVHAGGPLDEGELVDGNCIRCPWHGSTFELDGGAVVRGPAAMDQPSWEVKIEDGRVLVRSSSSAGA